MKKIIISLAAASVLLFTGCFIDSDTATVRINLGNIPVAKVEKKSLIDRFLMIFAQEAVAQEVPSGTGVKVVHLGAFDSNKQLLAKKSINVTQVEEGPVAINTVVEFDVPARSGVTIIVLGEREYEYEDNLFRDEIRYYGKTETPLNLSSGEIKTASIDMYELNASYINLPESVENKAEWDKILGGNLYRVYRFEDDKLLQRSSSNTFESSIESGSLYIIIEFGFINKVSNHIDFGMNNT